MHSEDTATLVHPVVRCAHWEPADAGRGVRPAPGMKWGRSNAACERRPVGPGESLVFAGLPFFAYFVYQEWRHKRPFGEILRRAGLQRGAGRSLAYSAAFACAGVAILVFWPPPLDPLVRKGSPQRPFVGLGLGGPAVLMALLYGVVQTGFPEELLFRG